MRRSKLSSEQIVPAIQQTETDTTVGDLCRQLWVTDAAFYGKQRQYGLMGVSHLRRQRVQSFTPMPVTIRTA